MPFTAVISARRAATKSRRPRRRCRLREAGNVFMMLFGAVAMVGVIGAATMTVMKGPVKTMSMVTKRTVAENNMIAAGKLALIAAASQANNDCDGDLYVEPLPFGAAVAGFTGGGELPTTIGVAKQDPWGRQYVYCAWDHGPTIDDAACGGATQNRLQGTNAETEYTLAIISAGPNGIYSTTCNDFVDANSDNIPDTPLVDKTAGSDDIVLGYTYAEAGSLSGGLWGLQDPNTAEITKNLSVKDTGGMEQFAFDAGTKTLTIGGTGEFPSVKTDFLSALTGGGDISVLSPIASSADITTTGNVGIGTASPGARLEVSGNFLQQNGDRLIAKNSSGVNEIWMWPRWVNDWMYTNYGANGWIIRNNSNVEKIRITASGNVGIGTASPGAKLDVAGGIKHGNDAGTCNAGKAGTIRWNGTAFEGCDGTSWAAIGSGGGISGYEIVTNSVTTTNATQLIADVTCPVGKTVLGGGCRQTTTGAFPAYRHEKDNHPIGSTGWHCGGYQAVTGQTYTVTAYAICGNTNSGGGGGGGADSLGNHTATQDLDLGTNKLVGNGGSAGISVDATGNVGIGTTAPGAKLDVAGGIKLGNVLGTCDASKAGTIRWSGAAFEGCDGTSWAAIGGGGNGGPACASPTGSPGQIISNTVACACSGSITTTIQCQNGTWITINTQNSGCDNRCSCLTADTMVIMVDGTSKEIHKIIVGDKVLGDDGSINTVLTLDRTLLWKEKNQHLIRINGKKEFMTDNHPVMTTDGWKALKPDHAEREDYDALSGKVAKLEIGDEIVLGNGKTLKIETIDLVPKTDKKIRLYNLHLDGNNTYVANNIVVHGVQEDADGKYPLHNLHDGEPAN